MKRLIKKRVKKEDKINTQKTDYNVYYYSAKERIIYGFVGAAAGFIMMYLFYSNKIVSLIGSIIGAFCYLRIKKRGLCEKRKWTLMTEFKDALSSMTAALTAGYSMENAVGEAYKDLKLLYGEERIILTEFREIRSKTELGVPIDESFYDLGVRSGVSDIIVFSQVYVTARKSGGNLIKIMKRTADAINEKIDIEREVKTMIAGKRLESLCMMVIPLLIIVYLRFFSPGFLNPLYQGVGGRVFMSVAMGCYLLAVWWSRHIMDIKY